MEKKLYWCRDSDRNKVLKFLLSEQIVTGSTDTVPGLFALPSQKTFERLNKIKERQAKPYLLLVASLENAKQFTPFFENQKHPLYKPVMDLVARHWPGPLTLILPAHEGAPKHLTAGTGGVALRVPNHQYIQALLKQVPALFSTSANTSEKPAPQTLAELDSRIVKATAAVIEDKQERLPISPSTLIDCTGDTLRVIRPGAVPTSNSSNRT